MFCASSALNTATQKNQQENKMILRKLKNKSLLLLTGSLFSNSIFATCNAGDQLCNAQQTFNANFGPGSTVVYIILGAGAIGSLIHCLTTHNYKMLLTVVVGLLFIGAIFAMI